MLVKLMAVTVRGVVSGLALALSLSAGIASASRGSDDARHASPRNDDIRHARHIGRLPFAVTDYDTIDATMEPGEPLFSCLDFPQSQSVWYRFEVRDTAKYAFDTAGSTYDTQLSVYAGPKREPSFDKLRGRGCSDDVDQYDATSYVEIILDPGTYYVQITDYGVPSTVEPHLLDFRLRVLP